MRLQGKVLIENQGKTNSEKNRTLTRYVRLCGLQKRFSYNMNKLICETKQYQPYKGVNEVV